MTDDIQLYRVPDAMQKLRMSRSVIYEQLRSGRLRSVKQGRCRLIPASALTEYIALLQREASRPSVEATGTAACTGTKPGNAG
ncbi:helix-turn-helix domain-containing protein [Nonomuraea cypriaca]|uniref:helix-turn-helix domain-containing protein n=1 Tax=Nonomuraea cypriaca TaxID=1187855 RepID=UPI001A9C2D87|nr:helix-turn-helix domain-containing protein [Nonomuraea cypriaca]